MCYIEALYVIISCLPSGSNKFQAILRLISIAARLAVATAGAQCLLGGDAGSGVGCLGEYACTGVYSLVISFLSSSGAIKKAIGKMRIGEWGEWRIPSR